MLTVCAMFGVVITLAVAWAAEVWAPEPDRASLVMTGVENNPADGWIHAVPGDWPDEPRSTVFAGARLDRSSDDLALAGGPRQRIRQFMGVGVSTGTPMTFMGPPEPVLDEYRSGFP